MFSSHPTEAIFFRPGTYVVERCIPSSASKVFFVHDETGQQFCVKMWIPCDDIIYKTVELNTRIDFLLEGWNFSLDFNGEHARRVYQGLAPIELIKEGHAEYVKLGNLLTGTHLQKKDLEEGKEYALIMVCLNEHWQLNDLLSSTFRDERAMKFLARELCWMHNAQGSLPLKEKILRLGRMGGLYKKLELNKQLFRNALTSHCPSEERHYRFISRSMGRAYRVCRKYFLQRYSQGSVKRCHGDLKATNLWICPSLEEVPTSASEKRLLALDCVDFKPEFCYIDTLSDIATLAVDIELYIGHFPTENVQRGRDLAYYFLEMYLNDAREHQEFVWLLLEYYMTEKAMIGAYICISYEEKFITGKHYLALAEAHAKTLRSLLAQEQHHLNAWKGELL